jgi:tripeptidyl-peptidase-1
MIRTYLPCLLLLALPTAMGISESYIPRSDFIQGERSIPDTLHELVFSIKQRNINVAKTELYERSTPGNPKYQKWLSSGEIKELIQNDEGADAVLAWLSSNGLAIKWESYRREYMKVVAPISRWEELLDMEFYNWEDLSKKDTNSKQDHSFINRAKEYTIPAVLESHLSAIFHTVQVPPVFKPHYKRHLDFDATELSTNLRIRKLDDNESKLSKGLQASKTVTISWLNSMYVIESNTGSEQYNQSVFETSSEFYSQDDSTQFQQQYNLPLQQMIEKNGQETSSCNAINDCSEGNLDVQYISGIAQGTGTIYWYVPGNDAFVDWITAVSDEVNPPMSNSISWGTVEQYQAVSTMQQFDYQAMILGLQGVTITVSSGDDGVSGNSCSCTSASGSRLGHWSGATSWTGSGYFPSFPATSPHVTAVGATMGPGGRPSLTSYHVQDYG